MSKEVARREVAVHMLMEKRKYVGCLTSKKLDYASLLKMGNVVNLVRIVSMLMEKLNCVKLNKMIISVLVQIVMSETDIIIRTIRIKTMMEGITEADTTAEITRTTEIIGIIEVIEIIEIMNVIIEILDVIIITAKRRNRVT
eukprot:GHVR01079584.1.p1 GENE.GHVR01079584.1~~GHVR01079584.1.p1  ORF type:complete len:142 (-),score=0.97 GHVR01079584.1:411-836(-)